MTVYVLRPNDQYVGTRIDVTTRSNTKFRALSPMLLGPVFLHGHGEHAQNVENGWQYSKVYSRHVCKFHCKYVESEEHPHPDDSYFEWRDSGFKKQWADRYPMGKGAAPEFSWWYDTQLDYIEARKQIYIPVYRDAVLQYQRDLLDELIDLAHQDDLTIVDFDAYNHHLRGMTLEDVLNNPKDKMGHGFVLAMMIEKRSIRCE